MHAHVCVFSDHFEATYIGLPNRHGPGWRVPRYPIPLWNMFLRIRGGMDRTNNVVEGWHRGLDATLGISNPTIWKLLDAMRHKLRLQEMDLHQINAGRRPTNPLRAKWARLTVRLQNIFSLFEGCIE